MMEIFVIDTETSTTRFQPDIDGHIIEIGVARVRLKDLKVMPHYHCIVNDPEMTEDCWAAKHTDLTPDAVMMAGADRRYVDRYLLGELHGASVTSYNVPFDRLMCKRDLPMTEQSWTWQEDIMEAAARCPEIPRRHAGMDSYPTCETAYNYLCTTDPAGIGGIEKHRAMSDAMVAAHIMVTLIRRG